MMNPDTTGNLTEAKLVKMILGLIDAHDRCHISNQTLRTVFAVRSDRPDELRPLTDSLQERLQSFCVRYGLEMETGPGDRTTFTKID